ncbi:MAG: hypothetical protein FJX18_05310 [Alphaproteobacteria bacterium]|nr:hypothetical protein [Alphaproteobacteria bacterium]
MIKKLFLYSMVIASSAYATQIKTMEEGRLSFKVSIHDLNRIEIRDDRIHQVFGNKGTFMVEQDLEKGHLYLKPTSPSRPISLTIVSEKGALQDLLLIPVDSPGETLILKKQKNPHNSDQEGGRAQSLLEVLFEGSIPDGEDTEGLEQKEESTNEEETR